MNKIKGIGGINDDNKKPLNIKKKTKVYIIVACIFLIYCIYLLIRLVNNPTETFIVEQGKIYKEESVTGYIIRDEQVVDNETTGRKNSSNEVGGKESC